MQSVDEDDFMRLVEETDEALEKLEGGREDWLDPECRCYCVGDQADASDCPLHRR